MHSLAAAAFVPALAAVEASIFDYHGSPGPPVAFIVQFVTRKRASPSVAWHRKCGDEPGAELKWWRSTGTRISEAVPWPEKKSEIESIGFNVHRAQSR